MDEISLRQTTIPQTDDIVLCSNRREVVEEKLEEWRREMEDRGLKISRKKTESLRLKDSEDGGS